MITAFACWTRYQPHCDDHYKSYERLFDIYYSRWSHRIHEYWACDIDHELKGFSKLRDIKETNLMHWDAMGKYLKQIKTDVILITDSDTIIYSDDVFRIAEGKLKDYDVVSILDNSGKYDLFPANENRDVRRRIAPYLCFIKRDALLSTSLDFTPVNGEYDSFGRVTHELVKNGAKIYDLEDDRTSVFLNDDNKITIESWLDTPNFKWSYAGKNLGYYHVRNYSMALTMLGDYKTNKEAYLQRKSIIPRRELLRLLAWLWIIDDKTGFQNYHPEILTIVNDVKVSNLWTDYINKFREVHAWLK